MISSEVQRTLVKSPPELWAEISDPEALARHLGGFGEIRITRIQPEQKVEWEAADASGSIVIKPSGWGTKVKLTVTRELSEAGAGAELDQAPEAGEGLASAEGGAAADTRDPQGEAEAEAEAEPEAMHELDAAAAEPVAAEQPNVTRAAADTADATELDDATEQPRDRLEGDLLEEPAGASDAQPDPEPERRRGFFARLFGRRRSAQSVVAARIEAQAASGTSPKGCERAPEAQLEGSDNDEPGIGASERGGEDASIAALADSEAVESEAELGLEPPAGDVAEAASATADLPQAERTSEHPAPDESAVTLAAELEQAEEVAAEQVTAVLTSVLDRLGAAHHRPFSRA
jgi:hypothetical protein